MDRVDSFRVSEVELLKVTVSSFSINLSHLGFFTLEKPRFKEFDSRNFCFK